MRKYLCKRILSGIFIIFISLIISFTLIHTAPGDPITILAGQDNPSPEMVEALTQKYGLDKSLPAQFVDYIKALLKGDLGYSIISDEPVANLILEKVFPSNAKLMRAQALSLRERTFIKAQTTLGKSRARILIEHIIPNGIFPIIANTTMNISQAILLESSLSFLGLGDPNLISWGQMVFHGKSYLANGWWVSTFSGLAIVVTVLAFYLIGDGLNNVLNPKLKAKR